MEDKKTNKSTEFTEEEESSFDFMEWFLYILKYWYLIVVSVALFMFWAYLQNRKWMPEYTSGAKVIIEEGKRNYTNDASSVINGFSNTSAKGLNNQMMLFGSSDLVSRTVKKLPLTVEYWTHGKFKSRNLYKISPIEIKPIFISDKAYSAGEFKFTDIDGETYRITHEIKNEEDLKFIGKYGQPLNNSYFFIVIVKTDHFVSKGSLYVKFRTEEDLVREFHDRLNLAFTMKGASVVDITLASKNPERDIDFINAHCDEFLQDNLDKKNEVAEKTINFINTQLGLVEDSLAVAEADLSRFRNENEILDVSSYSANITNQMTQFKKKQEELTLKKTYLDYLNDYLKGNIQDDELVMPMEFGIGDASLNALIVEYRNAKNTRDNVGKDNPYYKTYQDNLDQTKTLILEALNNLEAAYQIELKDFERQNETLQKRISTFTEKESQMKYLQRIYKIQDDYYALLLQKRVDALIQKSSNSPDNIIMERARILSMNNGAVKSKNYSQKMMIGVAVPIIILVIIKLLHFTIQNKNEVKRMTKFPILGSVAHDAQNGENPYIVQQHANSIFTESFRLLRTQIEFSLGGKRDKGAVILTTSSQPGDGKSYFCINLASIYAIFGKKVVLLGCDFRKPALADKLKLARKKGLTDYLSGQISFEDALLPKDEDKTKRQFDLILSGTIPPNPGDLMHSQQLADLINDLREKYDYIIIDTAPLGLVSDAFALMKDADVNLFVARYNHTGKKFFKSTVEQIQDTGVNNVYVVLNDETEKDWNYRYGGYGRYGKYGKYGHYGKAYGYYGGYYLDDNKKK